LSLPSGSPYSYHFDLRDKVTRAGGTPPDALALLRRLTVDPARSSPVDIIQLGLGALQQANADWLPVVAEVVAWIEQTMDERGLLACQFPMPHTFPLVGPWPSALAQGEAASLLVRSATAFVRSDLLELADRAVAPLLDAESPLVVLTPDGPVLQEYPTTPPAHVLNGWITSLWGLYDVAHAPRPDAPPADASMPKAAAAAGFEAGVAALAARLYLYRTPIGWSRYDLYPHPLTNVASPFYHRLHVGHLRTLNALAPREIFTQTADDWERTAASAALRSFAVSRKVLFRFVRPRWKRVRRQ
jgi:heparosan-N-sulfate-glucuronate 5-epimerase